MKKFGYLLLVVALLGFGIAGCTDVPSSTTVSAGIAANPGVVFGKVIDNETRKGITGATVYLKVNGAWVSATTAGGTSTNAPTDTAGDFTIRNLPLNATFPVVVKGPQNSAYVMAVGSVGPLTQTANTNHPNNEVSWDLGQIAMEKGFTVTLYVVDGSNGSYVRKSDNSDLAIYLGMPGSSMDVLASRASTTSDAYTVVIPRAMSAGSGYRVSIPAIDTNGDGTYDYASATSTDLSNLIIASGGTGVNNNVTTNVVVNKITNAATPSVVADSIRTAGSIANGANTLPVIAASDGNVRYLFNVPVEFVQNQSNLRFTYIDDLKTLSAAGANVTVAATISMSANDTVMTVTPASAFIEGESYTLAGTASTMIKSKAIAFATNTDTDLTTAGVAANFDITLTGTGTIGSTPVVTVDNGNFCTNGAVITAGDPTANCATGGTASSPAIIFPEPVWGYVSLHATTIGATTTNYYGAPVVLNGQGTFWLAKLASNDAKAPFNATGANREGKVYAFDLGTSGMTGMPATMLDHLTATPRQLKLEINAYDADGNTYQVNQTFNVE